MSQYWVLFGSHVGGPDRIKVGRFDADNGKITPPQAVIESRNPGYFIFTPDARFLYACNQADGFEPGVSGGVTALRFDDRTGLLDAINTVSAHGLDPSHLAFDSSPAASLHSKLLVGHILGPSARVRRFAGA